MKLFYPIIFIAAMILFLALTACGQTPRLQRIYQSCANSVQQAEIKISDGNIRLVPCPTKSVFVGNTVITGGGGGGGITSFNGLTAPDQLFGTITANDSAVWSSGDDTHVLQLPITAVSGADRTGYFSFFDAPNTLGKSLIKQDGTAIQFYPLNVGSPTNLYGVFDTAGGGIFSIGNSNSEKYITLDLANSTLNLASPVITMGNTGTGENDTAFIMNDVLNTFALNSKIFSSQSKTFSFGDLANYTNGNKFTLTDATNTFLFTNTALNATVNFQGVSEFRYLKTITPAGTTGAATINRAIGSVNFAASSNSLVVTNSFATTSSIVIATARTNDATCGVKNVVSAGGSFTINMTANCTTETAVGFQVLN